MNAFTLTTDCGDEIGVSLYRRFSLIFVKFYKLIFLFFHGAAKLDHSCTPNADFAFVGKEIKFIAAEAIEDPSQALFYFMSKYFIQIRISYVDLLMSTKRRQKQLLENYFFLCDCSRCSNVEQVGIYGHLKSRSRLTGLGFSHSSMLWPSTERSNF